MGTNPYLRWILFPRDMHQSLLKFWFYEITKNTYIHTVVIKDGGINQPCVRGRRAQILTVFCNVDWTWNERWLRSTPRVMWLEVEMVGGGARGEGAWLLPLWCLSDGWFGMYSNSAPCLVHVSTHVSLRPWLQRLDSTKCYTFIFPVPRGSFTYSHNICSMRNVCVCV